ncbi:MAG: heterodisulfide reductase-related iron-sulfur binding cluster [Deltaproteobacteria bacterium]|nr:heterodisulfide reductase-related iron-sulfur binding cluster [Deltaproteobacteria bacterium]
MNKKIAYYPGCIESRNKNLQDIFKQLGIEAGLISEWNCCGAPPSHYKPSFFNKVVMPLRNLGISQQKGDNFLYSGCQVCVKQVNDALKIINSDSMFENQAEYSLKPFNANLKKITNGSTGAVHLIDIITSPDISKNLSNNAARNLKGHSILLYTGCYRDNQKINILTNILNSFGASVNLYEECCGGEKLQNTTPVQSKRVENANDIDAFFKLINQKADETNSDYIVAVCSMCEKNIKEGIDLSDLDVFAPIIGLIEFIGFLFGMDGCGDLIIKGETKESNFAQIT